MPGDKYYCKSDFGLIPFSQDSVLNINVDPKEYGSCMGYLRKSKSGGWFSLATNAGTRSIEPVAFCSDNPNSCSTRGCSGNYIILGRRGVKLNQIHMVLLEDILIKKSLYIMLM